MTPAAWRRRNQSPSISMSDYWNRLDGPIVFLKLDERKRRYARSFHPDGCLHTALVGQCRREVVGSYAREARPQIIGSKLQQVHGLSSIGSWRCLFRSLHHKVTIGVENSARSENAAELWLAVTTSAARGRTRSSSAKNEGRNLRPQRSALRSPMFELNTRAKVPTRHKPKVALDSPGSAQNLRFVVSSRSP